MWVRMRRGDGNEGARNDKVPTRRCSVAQWTSHAYKQIPRPTGSPPLQNRRSDDVIQTICILWRIESVLCAHLCLNIGYIFNYTHIKYEQTIFEKQIIKGPQRTIDIATWAT